MQHASRRTQPHREGSPREPTLALAAMLRGQPAFLPNPIDVKRRSMRAQGGLADLLLSARASTLRR